MKNNYTPLSATQVDSHIRKMAAPLIALGFTVEYFKGNSSGLHMARVSRAGQDLSGLMVGAKLAAFARGVAVGMTAFKQLN